jgi:heat shock protein HspQ
MGKTGPPDQKTASIPDCKAVVHSLFPLFPTGPMDNKPRSGVKGIMGIAHMQTARAKYHLGQVLRHRKHPFRGVVFDVDAMFSNTEDWYENIPEESRPANLLAENDQSYYVAYVSEQNLVPDDTGEPVDHPDLGDLFGDFENGRYPLTFQLN